MQRAWPLRGLIELFGNMQALTGPPSQDAIEDNTGHSYDYLLNMPIHSLTNEKVSVESRVCIRLLAQNPPLACTSISRSCYTSASTTH